MDPPLVLNIRREPVGVRLGVLVAEGRIDIVVLQGQVEVRVRLQARGHRVPVEEGPPPPDFEAGRLGMLVVAVYVTVGGVFRGGVVVGYHPRNL